MSPAEHIMEWAHNSQPLYRRMRDLARDNSTQPAKALKALSIATDARYEMVRGGEISRDEYSAMDILDAAKLILGWRGEE